MPGKDTVGSNSTEKSDWSSAWRAVSRLAATQDTLESVTPPHSPAGQWTKSDDDAASARHVPVIDHDLTGAIAEIEKASALLRRSEPALEVGLPSLPISTEGRSYWSVWVLIGTIWISATLVVASAAGAILYVLG
jgi:hypothetical protein